MKEWERVRGKKRRRKREKDNNNNKERTRKIKVGFRTGLIGYRQGRKKDSPHLVK